MEEPLFIRIPVHIPLPRVMFLDLCAEYDIPVTLVSPDDLHKQLAGT